MPVHGEGFRIPERLAGSVAHIESDLFVDDQIPRELPGIAHPLRMRRGFLSWDMDAAFQSRFAGEAVRRFDPVWRVFMQLDILPRKETVQLTVIFSPGTGFDHQIGRLLSGSLILRKLPQNGLILCQRRIADKKLNEERLVLTGLGVLSGKGMPPPVVAEMSQRPVKHAGVPGDIVMSEHKAFLRLPLYAQSQIICARARSRSSSRPGPR